MTSSTIPEFGMKINLNPFEADFVANPYAYYRALRNEPSASWSDTLQGWLITRYEDVQRALTETDRFSSDDRRAKQPRWRRAAIPARSIINSDPPDHTRLRQSVKRAFTPSAIASWESRIRSLVANLLEDPVRSGRIDIMEDIAVPLPLLVIAEMLGIAQDDKEMLREWLNAEIVAVTAETPKSETDRLEASCRGLHDYLQSEIARAKGGAGRSGSLIELLVAARDETDWLSDDEILSLVVLFLRAGSATTTNLIGNGMLALLRHKEAMAKLRAGPELWPKAIDELMRYDSPVQCVFRIVTKPTTVHGVSLDRGDRVLIVLASANRDERKFEDPDRLWIDRCPNEHLGFGAGIHYCLGTFLGRLEARSALGGILERIRDPVLAVPETDLAYAWSWAIRGLKNLPIRVGSGIGY